MSKEKPKAAVQTLYQHVGHITRRIKNLSSAPLEYAVLSSSRRVLPTILRVDANRNPADPNCTAKAALTTAWQNDKVVGSDSYIKFQAREKWQVGTKKIKLDDDIRALRRGMAGRECI